MTIDEKGMEAATEAIMSFGVHSRLQASALAKEAILAYEAAKPKEAKGWQDIASAPKDGTPVLVAWAGQPWQPAIAHEEDGLWGVLMPDMSFSVFTVGPPTMWQPLPSVSAMLSAAGDGTEASDIRGEKT